MRWGEGVEVMLHVFLSLTLSAVGGHHTLTIFIPEKESLVHTQKGKKTIPCTTYPLEFWSDCAVLSCLVLSLVFTGF